MVPSSPSLSCTATILRTSAAQLSPAQNTQPDQAIVLLGSASDKPTRVQAKMLHEWVSVIPDSWLQDFTVATAQLVACLMGLG